MVLGLALMVSGAIVLYALRRALWPRPDAEELEERVHYAGPGDSGYDPIDIPLDDGEYGARPIYLPPERGTVYTSRTTERPD
ncbi:hypothetical protein [Phytohabitans suffuscus]|uniref:Uncharacterized protein n=1 Tax=Phytohabitans suffuscus TaxID=624315 RepID=A0A6F8YH03_9ACTN|nr:hypothetical protein [Phytohabitans suffuscus]BCB85221.1 hypothetical protein Psuf_025340 [Phytohabitans suffuscus]